MLSVSAPPSRSAFFIAISSAPPGPDRLNQSALVVRVVLVRVNLNLGLDGRAGLLALERLVHLLDLGGDRRVGQVALADRSRRSGSRGRPPAC